MLLKLLSFLLPWSLRRRFLNKFFGFEIQKGAHIGYAWIFPKKLIMYAGSSIGHFTTAINLDRIEMGANATIGRNNWITGFSTQKDSLHFQHQLERRAELIVGESTAITKNHHLDCTNLLQIGCFTTIAGYNSQFLTHSIDTTENRQDSAPIYIGDYSFIGTNVVVLGGSVLPHRCILGAKSLLNKPFTNEWMLYGGVPAKPLQEVAKGAKYFSRQTGFVY